MTPLFLLKALVLVLGSYSIIQDIISNKFLQQFWLGSATLEDVLVHLRGPPQVTSQHLWQYLCTDLPHALICSDNHVDAVIVGF